MSDVLLMSEALRDRLDIPKTVVTIPDDEIRVRALSSENEIEGSLVGVEMREGVAQKISFDVAARDCQFLLWNTSELDVMVWVGGNEELPWIPLLSRAKLWTLTDPSFGRVTLTVTKQ